MITTVILWICVAFTFLCAFQCFYQTFTRELVQTRVASFVAMLYYVATFWLLMMLI